MELNGPAKQPQLYMVLNKISYAASEIAENYDRSMWWRNRITARVITPIHQKFVSDSNRNRVMDEEWDNLIILDACRLDLFEETIDTDDFDEYRHVWSRGSKTDEWTYNNFIHEEYGDTVYITANPVTSKVVPNQFHHLEELWRDRFDEEQQTVPPGKVADAAREAHDEYPNKRLIVHFIQPHIPFPRTPELVFQNWNPENELEEGTTIDDDGFGPNTVWEALEAGEVTHNEAWDAYQDNLEWGFKQSQALANDLSGWTVITSDHGNMIGDRTWPIPIKLYAHPRGLRTDQLTKMPWGLIKNGTRRDTVDDGVTKSYHEATETMKQKLAALGYR